MTSILIPDTAEEDLVMIHGCHILVDKPHRDWSDAILMPDSSPTSLRGIELRSWAAMILILRAAYDLPARPSEGDPVI